MTEVLRFKFFITLILSSLVCVGYFFVNERSFVSHRVDDYQREILISTRLLTQYAHACHKKEYDNFLAYVVHSVAAYERRVKNLVETPYFFEDEFINLHNDSARKYRIDLDHTKGLIENCE